jgi:hypothetical protein
MFFYTLPYVLHSIFLPLVSVLFKLPQTDHEYEVRTSFNNSVSEDENTTMYGQITFAKKRQRMPMAGLTKIRKSYADFINEHDYNKNR